MELHDDYGITVAVVSYSNPNGNECVEVSLSDNAVGIRDSRHPHGAVLAVGHAEWTAFLGVSDGVAR